MFIGCKPIWWNPLQLSAVTNCSKKLHLKWSRVPGSVFENFALHMHENKSGFRWKLVFFLIISIVLFSVTFSLVLCFSVFLSRLLDSCYYYLVFMNPVSGYSKLNYLKNQVLLKSKIRLGQVWEKFVDQLETKIYQHKWCFWLKTT